MDNSYIDSWKNSSTVFQKQLDLNLQYFKSGLYPPHWLSFISLMKITNSITPVRTILDIGCGCGAGFELCRREFPGIIYTGFDYSSHAIALARKWWKQDCFHVKNLWNLTVADLSYDMVYCDALFNVLPNGDEALKFFVSDLHPVRAILNRVDSTQQESSYRIYDAYNEISTYGYVHNLEQLWQILRGGTWNYLVTRQDNTFLIRKLNPLNQAASLIC